MGDSTRRFDPSAHGRVAIRHHGVAVVDALSD
jgi:hypothetical protein